MSRITLKMSTMDLLMELSEGNPGALTAMLTLMNDAPMIDPQAWAGELQPLLSLDAHAIYGSQIWVLYKDVCGQSSLNVLTLLRAVQLGLTPATTLQRLGRLNVIDFELLLSQVQAKVKDFGRN
jgi:hypothetical protein